MKILVKFIPKYFLDAILNGIVLLWPFSDGSLLVFRNTTDFCILLLCTKTLLNSFIGSNSFWWTLWYFSKYKVISPGNRAI